VKVGDFDGYEKRKSSSMHPSTQVIDPGEIAVYNHSAVHPGLIPRDSVKNGRGIVPLTTTRLLVRLMGVDVEST